MKPIFTSVDPGDIRRSYVLGVFVDAAARASHADYAAQFGNAA